MSVAEFERKSPRVRIMNSMREAGENAVLDMGRAFSTNKKRKDVGSTMWDPRIGKINLG
jgi:hypothetical protein